MTNQTMSISVPVAAAPAAAATVEVMPKSGEIIRVGFDTLQGFEALQRIAKAFSASSLVPPQYQGPANLANCVIAVEMASRMGASPLMVMQNLYIVHNRPAWSSQFLISAFNSCRRFSALAYRFTGEKGKDSWGCVAYAKELATGEVREGPEITIGQAKAEGWFGKNGSKWQTLPGLMLQYRAATFFIRTTAPELTMGLKTADEVEDAGEEPAVALPPGPPIATTESVKEKVRAKLGRAKKEEPPAEPPRTLTVEDQVNGETFDVTSGDAA